VEDKFEQRKCLKDKSLFGTCCQVIGGEQEVRDHDHFSRMRKKGEVGGAEANKDSAVLLISKTM